MLIWVRGEANCFSSVDWTGKSPLNRLNKSAVSRDEFLVV
jgi:hypothetical protein